MSSAAVSQEEASLPSDGYAAARAICRRHAKSFFFASYFLPKLKRDRAYAVYAYCRLLDDAVDEAEAADAVPERLARMQSVLKAVYAGAAPRVNDARARAALAAFADTVARCAIPRRYFDELIAGCRADLSTTRYETWADLERYCYQVAGVVGLIMCRVFGVRDAEAERQAVAMGNAMQLTNILRDVKEDIARGRVYLPLEDLDRFGVTEADLAAGRCNRRFRELMRFEVARARRLYDEGSRGLWHLPRDGSRLTAAVMAVVYGGILDAIERADYDVFSARRRLGLAQKLLRLPQAMALERRRP